MELSGLVEITVKEYQELRNDSDVLNCLLAAGVDNWSGWDDAMEMLNLEEESNGKSNR